MPPKKNKKRSRKMVAAVGRSICKEAETALDAAGSHRAYYNTAKAEWLMWGAAHREPAVAKETLSLAFERYPCSRPEVQALVEELYLASNQRRQRIISKLISHNTVPADAGFIRAAVAYGQWLSGADNAPKMSAVTRALMQHSGNASEFRAWLKTELSFEVWSRGVED